jgi:ABC-type polysaccharide/polyol phosphate export permease
LWRIWLRLGIQDVRLRFRRSAVGVAWIFINLIIMILSIGLIYGTLFKMDISAFLPMLTIGLILWSYLFSSIVDGGNAFVASEGYIKQISLPIQVYILRWFVSISLTMIISAPVYVIVAALFGVRVGLGTLWVLPGLLALAVVSVLAITVFAYLNAHFRDTSHLAGSLMQVFFYATPIIWPAEALRERGLGLVVDINPFHHLLEVVRHPLLRAEPAPTVTYLAVGLVILVMGTAAVKVARQYGRSVVFFL